MRVPDEELYNIALNEYQILAGLKPHKNVIAPVDIYYNKSKELMIFLMEYIGECKDLENLIKNRNKKENKDFFTF